MKSEKQIGGITADHGSVLRVETRITSESTAALQEALAVYDSYYLGAHLRPERIAVSSARAMFGLASLENRVPEVALHWLAACNAFKPREALLELDAILEEIGGTYSAPAMRVIPCTSLFAIGYKFADTIIQSQNAWYDNRINWCTTGEDAPAPHALPLDSVYTRTPHMTLNARPTVPRIQRHGNRRIFFAPIEGQGAAPFIGFGTQNGTQFSDVLPMRWAVYFQTSDVEITSPAKKLVMIAYLNEMFKYFDGRHTHFMGRRQYSRQYRSNAQGDLVPHEIIANLLIRVLHTAVGRLEYLQADAVPSSDELQLIRAIVNVLHLLDHPNEIMDALMSTTEMRQFMRMLLISMLSRAGHFEQDYSSDEGTYDLNVGLVPPQAARFLFEDVAYELPAHLVTEQLLSLLTDGRTPRVLNPVRGAPSYREMIAQFADDGSGDKDVLDQITRIFDPIAPPESIGATDSMASMRADYVAAAIAARMRESLPVLVRLMRGEIPGFEHIHTDVPMVDMDVTVSILETMELLFSRDLVGMAGLLEWEEPYTGARWSTQFGSFSVNFPVYPLRYVLHDVASDIIGEISDVDPDASSAVASALQTLGISLIQCEPALTFVRLGSDKSRTFSSYFFQELEQVGRDLPVNYPAFHGNMAVGHGALKVRSIYFVYSEQIWHNLELGLHANTQRNYAPQPLPEEWAPWVTYKVPLADVRRICPFVEPLWHALTRAPVNNFAATLYIKVYLNPAFQDIAGFLPYVQMYAQTPPEAHTFALAGRVEFNEQMLCNLDGTVVVPESPVRISGLAPSQAWRLPNLSNGLAYTPRPVGHMTLPLLWDALR